MIISVVMKNMAVMILNLKAILQAEIVCIQCNDLASYL